MTRKLTPDSAIAAARVTVDGALHHLSLARVRSAGLPASTLLALDVASDALRAAKNALTLAGEKS